MAIPIVKIELHVQGNDLTRIYITLDNGKVTQTLFTAKDSTVLVGHIKDIVYRNLVMFENRSKYEEGIGLGSLIMESAETYYNRGVVCAGQGDFTQAIADYDKAIELNLRFTAAYNNRGTAYARQGDLVKAIADFNKVIEINPKDAQAYHNRGLAYDNQGNITQAITDYSRAIHINPNYALAYNGRGLVYSHQGNSTQAISDFSKAIEIDHKHALAYYNRGLVYDNLGVFTKAISDYSAAIEINPDFAVAYNNRGIAYYETEEYDKAWIDVRKAEKLGCAVNPTFLNALKEKSERNKNHHDEAGGVKNAKVLSSKENIQNSVQNKVLQKSLIPGDHKKYLEKKNFSKHLYYAGLTNEESMKLTEFGYWIEALVSGKIKSVDDNQAEFLKNLKDGIVPSSVVGRAWVKYSNAQLSEALYEKAISMQKEMANNKSIKFADIERAYQVAYEAGSMSAKLWLDEQGKAHIKPNSLWTRPYGPQGGPVNTYDPDFEKFQSEGFCQL